MKKLFLLFALFITLQTYAQDSLYSRVYFLQMDLDEKEILATPDGGILITAQTGWNLSTVSRIDSLGNELWSKNFSSSDLVQLKCAAITADTCFYVGGTMYSSSSSNYEAVCIKMNGLGDTLWKRTFGTTSNQPSVINGVAATPDSGVVFCGNMDLDKHFVARLDKNGNLLWSNVYTVIDNINSTHIRCLEDSTIIVASNLYDAVNGNQGILMHFDANGNNDWSKLYDDHNFFDLEIQGGGFIALIRELQGYLYGTLKFDADGNQLSARLYPLWDYGQEVDMEVLNNDNMVFISGEQTQGSSIFMTDPTGVPLYSKHIMMAGMSVVEGVNQTIFLTGKGPLYGVKSLLTQLHIGLVRADSVLNMYTDNFSCHWTANLPALIAHIVNGTPYTSTATGTLTYGTMELQVLPEDLLDQMGCVDFLGSIAENSFEEELTVFPNGSNGLFTFSQATQHSFTIVIVGLNGQIIQNIETSTLNTTIDLTGFPSGLYYYKAVRDDSQIKNGKLLLQEH